MPPPLTSLGFGVQALTQAIQLTPVSPVQAILSTSRNILQMVDADKNESRDRQRLAQLVLDIALVYAEGMVKLDEDERDSDDIKGISSNLFRRACLVSFQDLLVDLITAYSCLEMVSRAIAAKPKRGWFSRTLGRSASQKTLQGCEADLRHISSILETQLQLRNVKALDPITAKSRLDQAELVFEERVSQAHQESLDLIKSQVLEQRRQKLEQSSFAQIPPAASPIFFGRSDHVGHLVGSLIDVPAHHAILGPGGIGKTSLGLNVLHDPRVVAVYGSHRYFLACETTLDASGILAGISDIFNLQEGSFLKSFRRHCDSIKSSMLFLLDNFETPWERLEARPKVEELLTQLCDIRNLSIIVTLRGAERPYGVQWTRPFLPTLGPLDFAAAHQTFVSIADVREDDADMTMLLEEVEGLPLAITLLGAQAQYVSCTSLLDQWRSCKTSQVTRGWESRLSSLDVSISLSLASTRFTSHPVALHLLQILSLLPDGTTVEELVAMTPNRFDVHQAVSTIFQVALAYTSTQDRIRVLAPIREYVQSKHPISHSLLASVFTYHSGLSNYAFTSYMTAESLVMEARLSRCIGNIHYVLQACLKIDDFCEESIESAVKVSSFRRELYLGSIAFLLEESVEYAGRIQKPSLHAACLVEIGCRMMSNPEGRASAEACLEESASILRKLPGSSDLLVFNLAILTHFFYLNSRYEEGIKSGQEAVGLINESTSPLNSALAYTGLGEILIDGGKFQDGTIAMASAASCFEPNEYPIMSLRYSRSLSWGYSRRSMFTPAIKAADASLNLDPGNSGIRRHWRAALLLSNRGFAYMYVGRYEDAINDFQQSIDVLASAGKEYMIGVTLRWLGTSHLGCGDFQAASIAFQVAFQIPCSTVYLPLNQAVAALELCQGRLDQAIIWCVKAKEDVRNMPAVSFPRAILLKVLGQIHIRLGDATEALSMCVLSVIVQRKMGDPGEIATQISVLGDAYFFIERDIMTAKACYQASLDLVRYAGVWRWVANALMRLGVMNHLEGDSSLAARRLNQAITFYEKTAGMPWVAYCKERLRVIDQGIVEERVPFFPAVFECY